MSEVEITALLKYDADLMHGNDPGAKQWFMKDILLEDKLKIFSSEIGDEIGTIKILTVKE